MTAEVRLVGEKWEDYCRVMPPSEVYPKVEDHVGESKRSSTGCYLLKGHEGKHRDLVAVVRMDWVAVEWSDEVKQDG